MKIRAFEISLHDSEQSPRLRTVAPDRSKQKLITRPLIYINSYPGALTRSVAPSEIDFIDPVPFAVEIDYDYDCDCDIASQRSGAAGEEAKPTDERARYYLKVANPVFATERRISIKIRRCADSLQHRKTHCEKSQRSKDRRSLDVASSAKIH